MYLSSKVVKSISNFSKVSLISSSSRFSFRFISFISCFVNDSTDSKCRLDRSVYDDQDRWIAEKRRCECKELIDKGECDIGSIWNHSNCEGECDKSCDVGEYLEYEKYKWTKKISVNKLIEGSSTEECSENVEEVKTAGENECVCSYLICIVLAAIAVGISVGIGAYFVSSRWSIKKDITCVKFDIRTQTTI